jgi:7 transmembrane sweet-taste receptor of 3 GCPR
LASGIWVFLNRSHKLVRASQPEFLYLLCFGAALVAPSVMFVSFDEEKDVSVEQLSRMCSAFPWFFVTGYLTMYCALFSKLWRLSKLLKLRRIAVNVHQVLWPYMIFIGCSLVVLTVWQIVDPLVWVRDVVSEPGAPYETFGECSSVQYGKTPFILALGFLIFLSVATTAVFSWKLRNVQSELAESRWIFACICLHLQTWLVGGPVFYITYEVSRDASYIMVVALTVTFSVSQVGLVVVPKIHEVIHEKYFTQAPFSTRRISFDVGTTHVTGFVPTIDGSAQFKGSHLDLANQNEVLLARNKMLENQLRDLRKRNQGDHIDYGPLCTESISDNQSLSRRDSSTKYARSDDSYGRDEVERPIDDALRCDNMLPVNSDNGCTVTP